MRKLKLIIQLTQVEPLFKFYELAYLGAYGAHMFALWVWVGDGTNKTFFFLFYHFAYDFITSELTQ